MSKFFNDTMNGLLEAVEIKRASNTHSKTLVSYPVIFTDVERNILIEVPDLEILTQANEDGKPKGTIADAIKMARDAIGISCIDMEDNGEEIKSSSLMKNINIENSTFGGEGKNIVSMVDVDLLEYRNKIK